MQFYYGQLLSILKKDSKSYFKGGESAALIRLEKKVRSEEKYIRNFIKPRTTSTNKPENFSQDLNLYCAVIVKKVDEKTRSKTSINELLRS